MKIRSTIRKARMAIWVIVLLFFANIVLMYFMDSSSMNTGTIFYILKWIQVGILSFLYVILIFITPRYANLLNRRSIDWAVAAIGLPFISTFLLSILPVHQGNKREKSYWWAMLTLALALIFLWLGIWSLVAMGNSILLAISGILFLIWLATEFLQRRQFATTVNVSMEEMVADFGNMFNEFIYVETEKILSQGKTPEAQKIAHQCVERASFALIAKYRLTTRRATEVIENFTRKQKKRE